MSSKTDFKDVVSEAILDYERGQKHPSEARTKRNKGYVTIQIRRELHKKLKTLGGGQSFDAVIQYLLTYYKQKNPKVRSINKKEKKAVQKGNRV